MNPCEVAFPEISVFFCKKKLKGQMTLYRGQQHRQPVFQSYPTSVTEKALDMTEWLK